MAENSNQSHRQRIYSEDLLGIQGHECTIPKCRSPGFTVSTGWLELGSLGMWCMEFNCPDHGPQLSCGGKLSRHIDRVLEAEGLA